MTEVVDFGREIESREVNKRRIIISIAKFKEYRDQLAFPIFDLGIVVLVGDFVLFVRDDHRERIAVMRVWVSVPGEVVGQGG